jgi:hypothetical protein
VAHPLFDGRVDFLRCQQHCGVHPHDPLPHRDWLSPRPRQNKSFTATCACRGSPTPVRRNPSKLKSAGVLNGLMGELKRACAWFKRSTD